MRISDWSSDVCSSDLVDVVEAQIGVGRVIAQADIAEILADGRLGRAGEARIGDAPDEQLVAPRTQMGRRNARGARQDRIHAALAAERQIAAIQRSEERRGGKEYVHSFRSRWSANH